MRRLKIDQTTGIVEAEAGVMLPTLSNSLAKKGLQGGEWAIGIPGTLGGAIVMNAGSKDISLAKNLSLKECLIMEFRICQAMMAKHDFYEGVRANLVDKDRNPKWNPESINGVTEKIVNEHFQSLGERELFDNE